MIVLDASALLALMNKEPGWEVVARAATNQDSTISSVNYAEVLQKAARLGVAAEIVDSVMDGLDITVSPFGRLDARLAASLYRHRSGLSLADRVCLALARSLSSRAYTPPTGSGRPGRKSSASRSRPSAESERVARPVWEGPSAGLVSREPVHFASGSSRSKPRPFLYGEQSEAKATRDPDLMPALARAAGHVGRATGGSGWVRRMYRSNWGTVKAASP